MEIAAIHFIILMAMSGLTKGAGVLPDGPLNAAVGETVMFNPTLTSSETLFEVSWIFGDNIIIEYNTYAPNNTHPEYEGRITLFISTGSLELRNVTSNDSGQYSVIIVRDGGKIAVGVTELDVNDGSAGLSVGAISGIVILCLAASSAGAGGGYYIYKKKINGKAAPRPEINASHRRAEWAEPNSPRMDVVCTTEQEGSVYENTKNMYEN